MNFNKIFIGEIIKARVEELNIDSVRICKFFKFKDHDEIELVYQSKSLDTKFLLMWSKLLKYDFFRLYSQHLILYSPPALKVSDLRKDESILPQFRKNIYNKALIEFILELIHNGKKTKLQIIEEYKIPKTTLYKWLTKYKK